ncbi:trimeric intracellular cation channel family protein [Sphingomonas sp. CJ99]
MTMAPLPLLGPLLPLFDGFGIAVFAATGALAATRARQTLVTACFFALITGVGGGTIRDLLIGAPVFWVNHPFIAAICLAAALLIWLTPERWWAGQGFDWLDALGLAAYAVFGAAKALAWGVPPVPAFVMGVVTACVGGIIRDVLAGEPSILMRPELYVTAAALAAGLHVGLTLIGLPVAFAAPVAALAGFGLRAAAIRWKLALPSYRGR